jgi:1-acyl-sn-glycerol-3-phosphate acyltransferase
MPSRLISRLLWPAYALYGIYAWVLFLVLAMLAVVGVLILPNLRARRALTGWVARSILRLAGMPLAVKGLSNLPDGPCVVVANHCSYLDGVVMKAALPARFAFVIKREMDRVPVAGVLLRGIGSEFVERFDRHKGASDARRVLRTASKGQSLVFFPEGTFANSRGLLKFHTGAFAIAARAQSPVVPCVIRGTRVALPGSRILPRPARLEVEILPPLPVLSESEHASSTLRDQARAAILARIDEPDLANSVAA